MFRFKHFSVEDEKSTMRVGTDSMILGSWARCPSSGAVLEIGTGCGVISLMIAQRSESQITAIDIHLPSVEEATANFKKSNWTNRLEAIHSSLDEFTENCSEKFDLIISNPPFFKKSLKSPSPERNLSRHDDSLSFESLIKNSSGLLTPNGRIIFIIPSSESGKVNQIANFHGLFIISELSVFSASDDKKPVRTIMVLSFDQTVQKTHESLVIRDKYVNYTTEYLSLTKEFHHFS